MEAKKWLALNYFLQYAVQGVFFQYWIVYLTTIKDLSVLEASAVFSMIYLARFISGIFLSTALIKKFGLHLSYKIIGFSGFISVLMYGFVDNKINLFFVTFLFGITYFSLTPLTETTSSLFLKEGNVDYGQVRVFGSISFMIVGIIVGGVLGYISNSYIFYVLASLVFIYFIFTLIPAPYMLNTVDLYSGEVKKESKQFLWMKNDIDAILLILVFFFLQLSHAAYNNYNVLYLESFNISLKWLTGFIVSISVISEILFFVFSNKLPKNISAKKFLLIACFVATFRWLILAVFKNVYVFVFMQTLHALTFALAQIAFILLLNSKFTSDKTLDMQNLYSAVGFQLSAFLGMYVVGFIWDISTSLVFFVSSAIAFIALIIATRLKF
ncbi:MFS transporter [Gemella sp. GH3]|uniref:MFS transporter n=1 Tax=unclassified Gemella TaxID=2624949 RepID=UPI0015D04709|nr:MULTISPECIES: MFS transporter [unclassified Gemella]MBF0713899.1 MFS transporter [Gemella sp. GH3.1]NYS50851.1 MFS transporter [Gemella sp. GH3]